MKESTHTPRGRSTSWLAIVGSLVCLAGCAGPLTQNRFAPTTTPAALPGQAAAGQVTGGQATAGQVTGGQAAASPATISQPAAARTATAQPAFAQSAYPTPTAYPTPGVVTAAGASGTTSLASDRGNVAQTSGTQPYVTRQFPNPPPPPGYNFAPPAGPPLPPGSDYTPPAAPVYSGPGVVDPYAPIVPYNNYQAGPRVREADLVINGFPARTGRIMLGGAVNSDAGVTGQLTVDERNFDITRWPRSFRDLFSGTAFRGAGQTFRIEAAPGSDFQRYTVQFADPNLFGYKPVSMSVSGFLYDRRFTDWDEQRLGGRLAFGYRVTPDLSVSAGISGQSVDITQPRVLGVPQLDEVLGKNDLYGGEVSLKHDTRDSPIQPSRGHYLELKFEEVFGDYDYARFEIECRRYWLLTERADSSGKQTISYSTRLGFSGKDTPIFENFFAGGYATMRGFEFRGASPVVGGVQVGGRFQWLNTVEYMFPITADDAFRGVAFVDFGTVEQDIEIKSDNFRVAPGLGVRVAIPMLGPAPLAFDFAYPVAQAPTDQKRVFNFYMSLIR